MSRATIFGLCWAVLSACSGSSSSTGSGAGGQAGGGGTAGGAGSGTGAGGASAGSGGKIGSGGASGASGTGGAAGVSGGGAGAPPDVGSGACPDFTPCGGDVVGSWTMATACFDAERKWFSSECPEVDETLTFSGSTEFLADGTTSNSLTTRIQAVVPSSCYQETGQCGDEFRALATCTPGDADNCVCDLQRTSTAEPGTYSIEGNMLVIVRDGVPEYSYFCREGNVLHSRGVDEENRISVVEWVLD